MGATLGFVGSVPVVGGVAAGAIQSALAAAARAKDEEWWAMVAARLASVEAGLRERGESLSLDDPEFLAAVHRATRAAKETADSEKRRILVDALANSGSWSTQPWDRRDRLLALVVRLTPLHVRLLQYFGKPSAFVNRATVPENSQTLSTFVAACARRSGSRVAGISGDRGPQSRAADRHVQHGDGYDRRAAAHQTHH